MSARGESWRDVVVAGDIPHTAAGAVVRRARVVLRVVFPSVVVSGSPDEFTFTLDAADLERLLAMVAEQ